MSQGGARTQSGPPPNPNALRRDREGEWTVLPAEGRKGETPDWPLAGVQPREWDIWRSLWVKPQAIVWEHRGQHLEVALLARRLSEAEQPEASTSLGTLVRQMMDSLGLTTPGLRSNRWRIAEDQVAEQRQQRSKPAKSRSSSRDRLKSVSSGGG